MKKTIYALATLAVLASCGSKEKKAEESAQPTETVAKEQEVKAELINPANFDFTKTLESDQVYKSIMFFYNTEFQFLVYPYNNKIIYNTQAYSIADGKEVTIDFVLKDKLEKQLDKNTPIVIKGKIDATNFRHINVVGATIVSEGKAEATAAFDINKHKPTNVYNPKDLYDFLTKWESKVVTLKGFYQGYTESTGASKNILERRVDIGETASTLIGCSFNTEPTEAKKLSSGVNKMVVKGTISHVLRYQRPYMIDCEQTK